MRLDGLFMNGHLGTVEEVVRNDWCERAKVRLDSWCRICLDLDSLGGGEASRGGRPDQSWAQDQAGSRSEEWRRFDLVEVGTSDFRTLTQFLEGTDTPCPMDHALRTWNPAEAVGLAVDPVWHLLQRLPDLDGVQKVQKVQAAIGATDGWQKLHYVQEDALQRFPCAYSAWLARTLALSWTHVRRCWSGCNMRASTSQRS